MQDINLLNDTPKLTQVGIAVFLQEQTNQTAHTLRRWRSILDDLSQYLPGDKMLTRERLTVWKETLHSHGYAACTITNYVKCVNRYLVWNGFEDLCFKRGQKKDLTGLQFGRLKALYPLEERNRKDVVWHCVCECGKEVDVTSSNLISGNTTSCGCRKVETLFYANKYYDGTSIEQATADRMLPTNTSGYTGVYLKKGKWAAQIKYKGTNYYLGSYYQKEEAARAYWQAKQRVKEDAENLLVCFQQEYPAPPHEELILPVAGFVMHNEATKASICAVRSDNTTGIAGVWKKREKWAAKITWQKKTYSLGSYEELKDAIAARKGAEKIVVDDIGDTGKRLEAYVSALRKGNRVLQNESI